VAAEADLSLGSGVPIPGSDVDGSPATSAVVPSSSQGPYNMVATGYFEAKAVHQWYSMVVYGG
jgi:hypothetical protein